MNRSETALVLAKIAAIDNRRLDDPTGRDTPILDAWHDVIGDLNARDCIEAVRIHRQQSTEWVQPAHIRSIVEDLRWNRIKDIQDGQLTPDLDGFAPIGEYLATHRARARAIEDGMPMTEAIATIPPQKAIEGPR